MNVLKFNIDGPLVFQNTQPNLKAAVELTNSHAQENVAFKVRTTDQKMFIVKPVIGIIQPGKTMTVDINL